MSESIPLKKYKIVDQPKLLMTLLVKNEADIIEHNIIFHKAHGVDAFIATDNNSSDGTREILQKYKDKGWILDIIDEPDEDYQQKEWVHRMILQSKQYEPDWIINCDADEFWISKTGNLKDEIKTFSGNKIYVPQYHMRCKDGGGARVFWENNEKIVRLFSRLYRRYLIFRGILCRYSQLTFGIPKVMHRLEDYRHIHMGNHWVAMENQGEEVQSTTLHINHYNIRGYEQFRRKMILGAEAVSRNKQLSQQAARHWRYFLDRFQQGIDMETEYRRAMGDFCLKQIAKYKLYDIDNTVRDFFRNLQVENE